MDRRSACKLISIGGAGLALGACGAGSSSPAAPQSAPAGQLVQPTDKYKYEVIVTALSASVREVLEAAGLTLDAPTKQDWKLSTGEKFAGTLVLGVKGPSDEKMTAGQWRVDINRNYSCLDIANQWVRAGERVQFFLNDNSQTGAGCAVS